MDNIEKNNEQMTIDAVNILKTAILQSQARATKAVNQEQLALYYGVGRYISANTRNKNWGTGMIKAISQRLRSEIPGLRGFGETNLKNMRIFYEAWNNIESRGRPKGSVSSFYSMMLSLPTTTQRRLSNV